MSGQEVLWGSLSRSWSRSLRARNLSPQTVQKYAESLAQLVVYLSENGDVAPADIKRRHVEEFIGYLLETRSPGTASVRYRALQQFFTWAVEEGECPADPTARMKAPVIPEVPVPVVSDAQLKVLLKTCSGRDFTSLRDTAVIRLFMDGGLRLSELAYVQISEVDLDLEVVLVLGKGRRPRSVPFASKTGQALDRYLRVRSRHRLAARPELWLGERGKMPDDLLGHPPDHQAPRPPGRPARAAPAPAAPHRRPRLDGRRWQRDRRDAALRLEVAADAQPLRRIRRR